MSSKVILSLTLGLNRAMQKNIKYRAGRTLGLLVLLFVYLTVEGQGAGLAAPGHRVLAKLKAPLVEELEASLSPDQLELAQPTKMAQAWISRHNLVRLRPLYPQLVKAKKQSGKGYHDLTDLVRERFPLRAARHRGIFDPPDLTRSYLIEVERRENVAEAVENFKKDPLVEFVQADKVVHTFFVPDDPYYSSHGSWGQNYDDLYGLKAISCSSSWDLSTGTGVVVAVIDSGIADTHPDITNNVWINTGEIPGNGIDDDGNGFVDDIRGWDFVGAYSSSPAPENDPSDLYGHGTHVAGTIAAEGNNGLGVIGVAWGAKIMAVKGFDDSGSGDESALANAIRYAVDNGADVINASWGGDGTSQILEEAVNYAVNLGVVFVAAAGNGDKDFSDSHPANIPASIRVGAVDANDRRASFSSYGRLDVVAPGVGILSLRAPNTSLRTKSTDPDYVTADGTSMAAPHVSGVVALLLSHNPGYSVEEIRQVLRSTADDPNTYGFTIGYGYGRINANRALQASGTLECHISSPGDRSVASQLIAITGVAQGQDFASYTLEYGVGETPTTWIVLTNGSNRVSNDTLGLFNATTLADGPYTIRLRSVNNQGSVFEDRVWISVDCDYITSPARPALPSTASTLKPANISITGTASGPNFRRFQVAWSKGIDTNEVWSTEGIQISQGGLLPVTNGLLATWNAMEISNAGYYTFRLKVEKTGFTNIAKTYLYLEPDLYSERWPQWLHSPLVGGVIPAHDANGQTRLVFTSPDYWDGQYPAQLWSFALDGSYQTQDIALGNYMGLAAANIDGRPGDEVLVADDARVLVFPAEGGSPLPPLPSPDMDLRYSLPAVADLNASGFPSILALAGAAHEGQSNLLYAWTPAGAPASSHFPVAVSGPEDQFSRTARLLPIDLNGDGRMELLVVTTCTNQTFSLKAYASDGSPFSSWAERSFPGWFNCMVSGDVNGDGRPEVILSYSDRTNGILELLSASNQTLPGWPVRLQNDSGFVVVADMDRDGIDEVVAADIRLIYVFRGDGQPFSTAWPIRPGPQLPARITVADINGDGFPEILTTQKTAKTSELQPGGAEVTSWVTYAAESLCAYDRQAKVCKQWEILGMNRNQPEYGLPPLVGDFDADGKVEIALCYHLADGGRINGILNQAVLTVLAPNAVYLPNQHDWPMIYHDPQNTSRTFTFRTSSLSLSGFTNGSVGMGLTGTIGSTWIVQSSSNLVHWVPFSTNRIPAAGAVVLSDSAPQNSIQRFYRSVLQSADRRPTQASFGPIRTK